MKLQTVQFNGNIFKSKVILYKFNKFYKNNLILGTLPPIIPTPHINHIKQ